ncbi:MAG: MFS transporter [Treponema sp.]|jgi:PPP family 3-phenylpropionic acid transporter|nr:MFS transporter [Treponema sp.]
MRIGITLFFFFAAYGVGNVTLPLILRNMGYSVFHTGILMGVFETAGIVGPLVANSYIEKTGKYGLSFLVMAFIMMLLPIPLVLLRGWWWTALCLVIFAVSLRGSVPLADSITTKLLGDRTNLYGVVRCAGSAGYVIMVLIVQFFSDFARPMPPLQTMLWLAIPALPFVIILLMLPGFLQTKTEPTAEQRTDKRPGIFSVFQGFSRTYWAGILMIFLGFLALSPANRLLPLYVEEYLGLHASAGLYALSAGAEIPAFLFSRRILKSIRGMTMLRLCTAAIVVRMSLYILFPGLAGTVCAQLMHFATYGLLHPAAIVFCNQNAPRGKALTSISIYQILAGGLANVLGATIGGAVIERFGYPTLFISCAILPLFALALNIILGKKS